MATTPNLALPYPAATDAPDGPGAIYALAAALDARDTNWIDYNAGFNFGGGSGAGGFMRWRRKSGDVQVNGRVIFGTGPTLNASSITFQLPTAAAATRGIPFATRVVFTHPGGSTYAGQVVINDQFTAQLFALNAAGATAALQAASATVPFTPVSGDSIDIDLSYSTT